MRGKHFFEFFRFIFIVTFFSFCSKTSTTLNNTSTLPIAVTPTVPIPLAKIVYSGKTSYALKTPQKLIDIDPIRTTLGIRSIGKFKGSNNLGFVYVDMNNDGLEDIYYTYASDGNFLTKANVIINKGNDKYVLDESMLPTNFLGTASTRKSVVGDFNNDSLPDIFMCNHGYEELSNIGVGTWYLENNSILLSNKNGAYTYKEFTELGKAFWHGAASGDLNGDDFIVDINDIAFSELLNNPTRQDNCYSVVTASNTEPNAILDGFLIKAGVANGDDTDQGIYEQGGGLVGVLMGMNITFGLCLLALTLGYDIVKIPIKTLKSASLKQRYDYALYKVAQYEDEIGRIREQFGPLVALCAERGVAMRIGGHASNGGNGAWRRAKSAFIG